MIWQVGETVESIYRIDEIFTGGGMGTVYRVRHLGWQLDLALKHPHQHFLGDRKVGELFARECETWVNMGLHPHTATCHYVRQVGGKPCVFAEFVEGGSLHDWITSKRLYHGEEPAAVARMIGIAIQFAWGLDWAHKHSLVHQDVKPANVLMTPDGIVKVTDFGLAKAIPFVANGDASPLISSGGMTPAYCSPEQAAREALTKATDVWSWAASILEMFQGELSWQSGPAVGAALGAYGDQGRRVRGMPEMPVAVFELLTRCLHRDPARRFSGFKTIADRMCGIYRELFGEEFELEEPDADLIIPDALNNRAISLLDLGRFPEALALFQKTLNVAPGHVEATHNYSLLKSNPKQRVGFQLAVPRSGAEYSHNPRRFKRLIEKAKTAAQDGRQSDVQRYVQTACELPGFEQHPALIRFTSKVI
jgi:serine/threonine protein kinase